MSKMNFDSWDNFDKLCLSSHYRKNTAADKKAASDFAEMVEEMRGAKNKSENDLWEEYEREQKQRKLTETTDAEIRQAARARAIKRKKLLEYMQFLKQTSIKRADEEREMIIKHNKKNINNARYKPKTVYVPVSRAWFAGAEDDEFNV